MFLEKLLALLTALFLAVWLGVGLIQWSTASGGANALPVAARGAIDRGSARQEIEATIASAPEYARYFARLRETFTADYEAMLVAFAAQRAQMKERPGIDYYLAEAHQQLRRSRGAAAGLAENAPLSEVFARQLDVLHALAQEDKKICVAFLYGGTDLEFQKFAARRRQLVADMALANLEAIVSGERSKIEREKPTDTDFRVFEVALADHGLSAAEIGALLDGKTPDPPLEDARLCAAGQTYLDVLRILPEAARLRIYALAAKLMGQT